MFRDMLNGRKSLVLCDLRNKRIDYFNSKKYSVFETDIDTHELCFPGETSADDIAIQLYAYWSSITCIFVFRNSLNGQNCSHKIVGLSSNTKFLYCQI
jgi:hypothetical protein